MNNKKVYFIESEYQNFFIKIKTIFEFYLSENELHPTHAKKTGRLIT